MQFHRFAIALILLLCASSLHAQEPKNAGEAKSQSSSPGIFSLIPPDSVTSHVLKTPRGKLAYTATAGTLDLFGQDGSRTAKIFYTAYAGQDPSSERPLTFVFNGGPGAASAYLHLGLVGPRVLEFGPTRDDGTMPELRDNPDSWLDFTDLVVIDPVGTGWSRATNDEVAGGFYGVSQDADSLAKAIALYVQKNGRTAAPKYLLGESYGGLRSAKVAAALKDKQGMLVSGIVMLSPLIEGRFLFGAGSGEDPLAAALQLPALAAAKLERQGNFSLERLAEAERFAMNDYLVTLAGPPPAGEAARAFYRRVSEMTGVSEKVVTRTRGFVGDVYAKQSGREGEIVSPYDAGYSRPDAYPEASYARNDDPVLDGFTRAYGGAFAAYARDELRFVTDMTYTLLNEDVNRRWEWATGRGGGSRATASASTDIRDLLSVIPAFRLVVAHGYSDTLTPYGMSRYVLDHLPPLLAGGRTALKLYRGGHMFYTDPVSRHAFFEDIAAFYRDGNVE